MAEGNVIYDVATWLVPLVFAIVLHEISHGWVANAFGDPTARDLGRLSPNPIRHVDPIGTVALPMVLAVSGAPVFGWAKPVPVDSRKLRNPRLHMMLVALAGPGMNFLLALAAAFGLTLARAAEAAPFLVDNLGNFLVINLFLGVFNLLPVPPFDGGHIVEGLLPRPLVPAWKRIGRLGFPLLILLLVVVPLVFPQANVIEKLVVPPVTALLRVYGGLAGLA
ncbi:MAG TPA: site-2 protease family protein [Allosphingosinicella sp.]|nr:site-2 protease family protein [Allosphingosinicella sp.]